MRPFLEDVDRRLIANLSIPRNVADAVHELRLDPYTPSRTEADVHEHLLDLAGDGLVVNLGEHDDLAKLAASVERHPEALTMPDEKARNYAARLVVPTRRWRAKGDLWMLTDAGFEMLHEPLPGQSFGMVDRATVERLIDEQRARVIDVDPDNVPDDLELASGALLPSEFATWAGAVVKAWNVEHPDDTMLPPLGGGMPGYGDATELLILDADSAKVASYAETSPTWVALTTVAVTDADTGTTITEATGATGYARKSAAGSDFNSAAAGSRSNVNAIVFAAITAGTATCIGVARCTASTVGRVIRYGTCASTVISSTQTPPQLAAGALVDTLD